MKKRKRWLALLLLLILILPLLAAYEASVIPVKAHLEKVLKVEAFEPIDFETVFPQEWAVDGQIKVNLSGSALKLYYSDAFTVTFKILAKGELGPSLWFVEDLFIPWPGPSRDKWWQVKTFKLGYVPPAPVKYPVLGRNFMVALQVPCIADSVCQEMVDSGNTKECITSSCPTYPCGVTVPSDGDYTGEIWIEVTNIDRTPLP